MGNFAAIPFSWQWLIAGFPSPWRRARRAYWRVKFNWMPKGAQTFAKWVKVDPDSLIERGIL